MNNEIKAEAIEIIKAFNTPDGKPYLKANAIENGPSKGMYTIGWRCAMMFDPVTGDHRQVRASDTIDEDQAITLLNWAIVEVARWVDENLYVDLTNDQFSAIVSFYTAASVNNFFGVLAAVNENPDNLDKIGREMKECICTDAEGTKSDFVLKRREREFALYCGKYDEYKPKKGAKK